MTEDLAAAFTVVDTPASMRRWSAAEHAAGRTVGLVPTMGALHDGHLELIRVAHRHADVVAASIFVNPLQFNRPDDFELYPRPLDSDLAACRDAGVVAVYAPGVGAMYPPGFETNVDPGATAEPLEGAGRPGHFRGVCTVVTKLFNAVRPDTAVFGQKDFQQLAVVRRMAADLDHPVTVVGCPIVREPDGLAMSSRNVYLSPEQRTAAAVLHRALQAGAALVGAGERDPGAVVARMAEVVAAEPLARLDYAEVVDPDSLEQPTTLVSGRPARLLVTAGLGSTRLLDNLAVLVP